MLSTTEKRSVRGTLSTTYRYRQQLRFQSFFQCVGMFGLVVDNYQLRYQWSLRCEYAQ